MYIYNYLFITLCIEIIISKAKKIMMDVTICVCLLLIAAAVFIGLRLLLSKGKEEKKAPMVTIEESDGFCPMVEISGPKARTCDSPRPEDLQEPEPMPEAPDSRPLDEGPSDIETAVEDSCGGERLRQVLASLMRSGMSVVSREDGRVLSLEDILAMEGVEERVIGAGDAVPGTDPEPERKRPGGKRKPKRLEGAIDRLDSEFNSNKHK